MLTLQTDRRYRDCDGTTRRDFLRVHADRPARRQDLSRKALPVSPVEPAARPAAQSWMPDRTCAAILYQYAVYPPTNRTSRSPAANKFRFGDLNMILV